MEKVDKLTKAQIKKYLEYKGLICPKCESQNITSDGLHRFYMNEDLVYEWNKCKDCHFKWKAIYKLQAPEVIEQ